MERMFRIYCNVCTHIIAPSEYVKEELISFGVKKPITVIPNGVNIKKFKPAKNNHLREKLGLKTSDKIVLCVSRLAREKSIDFLIRAFADFVKKNKNVYFVIAGDGPERKNLEKLIGKLHVKKRIFILGHIPYAEIAEVYNGADVFIFASQTETEGMIVPEAMSSGLPVLAVRDRVFEQFIGSRKEGILVKKNIKDFNENLERLLQNPRLRAEIAKNARKKIEKFSLDRIAKKFETLYKQLA
jgi:1,2-diacylglycerol 3-alpha-glucosyltransferase